MRYRSLVNIVRISTTSTARAAAGAVARSGGLGIVTGAIIAAATACGPADPGPAVVRTEQDGVEIVSSARPAWEPGQGWVLNPDPNLVIGENTDDLDYVFSSVRGVVGLPDGRIVAGDYATRQLRFFDPEGTLLQTAGQEGEGPGELGVLADVLRCGPETLFVLDGMRYEVNDVSFAGEFGRRDHFEVNAGVSLLFPLYCNDAGMLLGLDFGGQLVGDRPTGFHRTQAGVWLLDSEGFVLQAFGEFPGVELFEFNGRTSRHPFGKRVMLELGNDHVYVGTADDFEIEMWTLDGSLMRRIRRPHDDAAITRGDFDRYVELESAATASDRVEEFRVRANNMPVPDEYPAYESFVLDAEENLWVQHFPRPGEELNTWSVFDPTGVWLGELAVPASLWVTQIDTDYVLGIFRDELGDQSVRQYALRR
jgi:hypothetical protein